MGASTKQRAIEHGVVQLVPFGMVRTLDKLLSLDAFEKYMRDTAKEPLQDDLSLGYSFLVVLVLERLIDSVLLDPAMFGLRWNDLVNRAHQRDVPFSQFPDKSNLGRTVRRLTTHYREFLPIRSFADLRKEADHARKDVLSPLLQWSEEAEFFREPDDVKLDGSRVRDELAMLFLVNCVQDLPYVIAAHNNTFQRGRWFEPQFHRLETEMRSQRFFDGFKLGAAYLWHSIIGGKAEELFTRRILSSKDWMEYYQVHPVIRRVLTDEMWDRVEKIKSIQIATSPAFRGLKREQNSGSEKDYLDRLEEIFHFYDVRLVGETYTARIGTEFLGHLIGALTYNSGKLRVLRFVHADAPCQNRYSYALFSWVPVALGDQSEWLLFFNFCDDYTPRGLSAYEPIEAFLLKYQARFQVSTFRFTPLQLLNYAMTRPSWSKSVMSPLTREHNNLGTVSGLRLMLAADRQEKGFGRGIILELLMILIVSKMGYQVKWRVETLGRELDLLAYKASESTDSELLIVECSTQYLESDLKELREKLQLARSNPEKLLERFGKKAPGAPKVVGWLVTTDKQYPDGSRKSEQISIISWESLKEMLQKQGIALPVSLEDHLTREEFPPRYILDPQSVITGVTPPPTEDGSPPKGRIMMHDGLVLPRNWIDILNGNVGYSKSKLHRVVKPTKS
jgi:hypothetical protein